MFNGTVTDYFTKAPLADIPVSDGKNIVLTDKDGRFSLPGWEKAHIVYVNLLTECHADWYISTDGHVGDYDFCVKPVKTTDNFSFFHVSDTEIEGRSQNGWLDFIRKTVSREHPLFFAHTGDLCRADGVARHCYLMNGESVGVPVRYTIGNHDFCPGDGGDRVYERYYGPTWYSFDCGKMHFVFLSIGCGDASSAYTREEREEWLKKDLAMKDPDRGVVLLCHHFHHNPNGYGHTVKRMLELAADKGLKAMVYGHLHVNSVYEYDRVLGICSSRPDSGGIDSSQAGIRRITVRGTELTTDFIPNLPETPAAPSPFSWCTALGESIAFCSPIETDGAVWICTGSDSYPSSNGIYKIDTENGRVLAKIPTAAIKGKASACDGRLYAQDENGKLYCIDEKSARVLWSVTNTPEFLFTRSGTVIADDKVIVGNPGHLYAYDRITGEPVWEARTASHENGPAAYIYNAAEKQLLVSGQWYGLLALSTDTGELVWESKDGFLGHFCTSTPYLEENRLYKRGNVEIGILCAKTGETLRKAKLCTSTDVSGSCAADERLLYVPTATHGVFGINKETLAHELTFPAGSARLFTVPYYYGSIQTVETTPHIRGDKLLFAASDGYIHIYNKNNALSLRKIHVGAPMLATPIYGDGYIITADFCGNVKRFELGL